VGGVARGRGPEGKLAAGVDARQRVETALSRLAPLTRRLVERACLEDEGLEAIERSFGWPQRSAKLALKLALAQLASG
jgi:DNA-directed RNA polymerase specialized sigma24 family protein